MENDVVKLYYPEPTIAQVVLEDRNSRNTFSPAFLKGLLAAFASLRPETKVVVIHGYENYFCCGGTQEELLSLFNSDVKTFADVPFYRILLDCKVPTISAMQGHALGGGLVMGSYADLIVMAEESLYSTNFMKYGFTPGMGGTYIIPHKFGKTLGMEMLFSAHSYHGGELKARGAQPIFVKKNQVIATAFEMAKELADKPLDSLMLLKEHLTETIRKELPAIIEKEIKMHGVSFKLPEVKDRILNRFGDM